MSGRDGLEFLALGPLAVRAGGAPVQLGGRKQRLVLAALLLHRGAPVARDRLIDALWPDEPPASADKSVQIYVSNLRKALGEGVIVTHGAGYALAVPAEAVDAERFAALADEGRRLLAAGDARTAAAQLRAALSLWRGPALADLADEPSARPEIASLEELRLRALEDRIEADLALGEDESLIPELSRLVGEHPLRERLRLQLMLALYRSGRQADALAAYRDAHHTLRDELGLEPSPTLKKLERAILSHDRTLGRPRPAARPRRRLRVLGRLPEGRSRAVALGALAAAALVAALLGLSRAASPAETTVSANSVAVIDPRTNELVGEVPMGGLPGAVAAAHEAVWVVNLQQQVLARIDPETRAVARTFPLGGGAEAVAAGHGRLWVASAARNEVVWIDPRRERSGRIRISGPHEPLPCSSTEFPLLQPPFPMPLLVADAVATGDAVWFVCASHALARVDPRAGRAAIVPYEGRLPVAVAYGLGSLWIANLHEDTVAEVDPASDETVGTITVPGQPSGVAVAGGALWVTACAHDAVWRIVLGPGRSPENIERIAVGAAPRHVVAGEGAVWVANGGDGTVSRIDPATGEVAATIPVGERPHGIAAGEGRVWVTVQPADPLRRGCTYP